MRWNGILISLFAALLFEPGAAQAASFGQVVAIGGAASDIALDESRGYLYVSNFAAGVVSKMSLSDNSVHGSINVAPLYPGALAISQDNQYLLVAQYGNGATSPQGQNALLLINLVTNARLTFYTGDAPLGVAFYCRAANCSAPQAMIVTTTGLLTFDPVSGQSAVLSTFPNLASALPVASGTLPSQILQAQMTTSKDGMTVWGIGSANTGNQVVFRLDARAGALTGAVYVTSPTLLPRVSVSADGSTAMVGYALLDRNFNLQGRYPNTISSSTITGSAIDSNSHTVYGQFPDVNQPTGPANASSSTPAGSTSSVKLPALLVMDDDNMTVQERLTMPENIVGRSLLNAAGSVMYAISESGVMVIPVGTRNRYNRVAASVEDVLVSSNFCNRTAETRTFTVADPGGNHTDFAVSTTQPGVTISQSSGVTPATVKVTIDPSIIPSPGGTIAASLTINSFSAVNQPFPVRLLINIPDPSQRGTVVDQPGILSDILPDPGRNRYYVLRQDKNQMMIFDGASNNPIATLRSATSPTMMAITSDQNFLLVGHNDSEYVDVYDLNGMQKMSPVLLPPGHFARSIAVANNAILVLSRFEGDGTGMIDSINLPELLAQKLPSLGVFKNAVSPTGVLTASPNGGTVLFAAPDGNVMLYSAAQGTWTASRQDLKALSGGFAASDYGTYVVGTNVFDASLVPAGTIGPNGSSPSGFFFVDQGGFMASATSTSGPGVMQRIMTLGQGNGPIPTPYPVPYAQTPVLISEAPLLPTAPTASTSSSGTTGTGTSSGSGTGSSSGSGSGSTGSGTTPTNGSGSISTYALSSFTRTIAPMTSSGTIATLTTSGITVLAANYDAAVAPPTIASIVNAANGKQPVAPGGLISIYGNQMSPVNMASSQIPLPTALGDSCLSVNGTPVPLFFVSSQQINAQLPFNVTGNASLTIHTPGGISDNYLFTVQSAAPSVFQSGSAGPETGLATIVRADNSQLVTPTNPLHPNDTVIIFLTGMGQVTPAVATGMPSPSSPLAVANIAPTVTLGGTQLAVSYAGLVPNEVGVYQINASVPLGVPQGLSIPLNISQGGASTTLNVRVVN